jgi:hypothetical protein
MRMVSFRELFIEEFNKMMEDEGRDVRIEPCDRWALDRGARFSARTLYHVAHRSNNEFAVVCLMFVCSTICLLRLLRTACEHS